MSGEGYVAETAPVLDGVAMPPWFEIDASEVIIRETVDASPALRDPSATRQLLSEKGALLIRDSGLRSAQEFQDLMAPMVKNRGGFMPYKAGINARQNLADSVLTAGTEPPHMYVYEHQEMAYADCFPGVIAFSCLKPAPPGTGATTVARASDILQHLPEEWVAKLRTKGLRHHFVYHDAACFPDDENDGKEGEPCGAGTPEDPYRYVKSWQASLYVSSRAEAEDALRARGWQWEWLEDGALHYHFYMPGYITLNDKTMQPFMFVTDLTKKWYENREPYWSMPYEKQPYWFSWGDEESVSDAEGEAWGVAVEKARTPNYWKQGDVLIVDNLKAFHGRSKFPTDCERKMAVVLGEPISRLKYEDHVCHCQHVNLEEVAMVGSEKVSGESLVDGADGSGHADEGIVGA